MNDLLKLAERCEQGHADYQRTLLSEAAYTVFGDEADHRDDPAFWPRATDFVAKLRAEAYLDAAMALVEEPEKGVSVWRSPRDGGLCCATVHHGAVVEARTMPLALCAAALRAKADRNPKGGDAQQAPSQSDESSGRAAICPNDTGV